MKQLDNRTIEPSISILIPTLNADRVLGKCLAAIAKQDYPKEKIEIIIADGGSTDNTLGVVSKLKIKNEKLKIKVVGNPLKTAESGKAVALKHAKNELVALIDSDNFLPTKNWLKRMVAPFADPEIIGSEPWEFVYRKGDSLVNRYCALIGMNDPYCYFVGNYDRKSILSGKWTGLEIEQEEKKDYIKVKIPSGKTPLKLNYTIWGNGEVEISYCFTPQKRLLRAGLQAQIPGTLRQISWFGRGPQESMLDRQSGYAVGIYSLDIEDFIHNYVRPQENANRCDVRWARFTDPAGHGIEICSTSAHRFNFSAWPYTLVDLELAEHIHELPRRENMTVNIDYAQQGVGDLTSALLGLPKDAQLLAGVPCEFSFRVKRINPCAAD